MKRLFAVLVFAFLLIGLAGLAYADDGHGDQINSNSHIGADAHVGSSSNNQVGVSLNYTGHESEQERAQNQSEHQYQNETEHKYENESDHNGNYTENHQNETEQHKNETETQQNYQFKNSDGKEYQIEIKTKTKYNGNETETEQEVNFHGYNVSSKLALHVNNQGNQSELKVNLSNGEQKTIKVLPDVAAKRAVQVFQDKNITVQLKQVGNGTNSSIVYEAQGQKNVKILGIFNAKANMTAIINSDNGEVTDLNKPWWYFLVFGNNNQESNNVSVSNDTSLNGTNITVSNDTNIALSNETSNATNDSLLNVSN